MPSRKSNSSETQPESRRSSLRRLSSIASFQTLFTRRKKAHTTDNTAASSSSNLSLSLSCTTNTTNDASASNAAVSIAELPGSSVPVSRLLTKRGTYVCLPDDPIGGMPRSRTLSNLPVPVKTRKPSNLSQSQSHARLPVFPSSTRLPSPPTSTRQHSHSRLASVESKVPVIRNRVKRSDTEPLLPPAMGQGGSFGRSTAFKENITLSPIKPLPAMDVSSHTGLPGHSIPSLNRRAHRSWRQSADGYEVRQPSAFGYVNPYASHPAMQIAREGRSSPTYKGLLHTKPTGRFGGPQSVQRWNSQPVLTNVTNNHRSSFHGEIKQTKLMSARQAPTPPLPQTPLTLETPRFGRVKSSSFSSSKLFPPSEDVEDLYGPGTKPVHSSAKPDTHSISCAEPTAYWAGRLCALTDRYGNEELAAQLMANPSSTGVGLTPKGQTDKMHTAEATTARTKRALEHLTELCMTSEAKESLLQFQTVYARSLGQPELAPPKPPTRTIVLGSMKDDAGLTGDSGDKSTSENRKTSFMDRLLGRQKRRSIV